MSRLDDFFRLYSGVIPAREQTYARSGVRMLPRTVDIDAFLAACGVRGRRR